MTQVTAAIIRQNNKILICQRGIDDECSMLWEFPGGKLENNETLENCIVREIKEELNLDIRVIDVFDTSVYSYAEKQIYFTFFNAEITNGEMSLNVHNDAQWVTPLEMKNYNFMPADVEIVDKISPCIL